MLNLKVLSRRRTKLEHTQDFPRCRGGSAVLLGRFIAFFRAVIPALAGTSLMHYPKFLASTPQAFGMGRGVCPARIPGGELHEAVAKTAGRCGIAAIVVVVVVLALIIWRIHKARAQRRAGEKPGAGRSAEGPGR